MKKNFVPIILPSAFKKRMGVLIPTGILSAFILAIGLTGCGSASSNLTNSLMIITNTTNIVTYVTNTAEDNAIANLFLYEHDGNGIRINGLSTAGSLSNNLDLVIPTTLHGMPVISIADDAFSYCYNLRSVTLSGPLYYFGSQFNGIFLGCTNLKSVIIENGILSTGDGTFIACTHITNVSLPNSITNIGQYAFAGCDNLVGLTIPNSVITIDGWAFYECDALENIVIPDSVNVIGRSAFGTCQGITNLVVGKNITKIDIGAFVCMNLRTLTLNATTPPMITETSFVSTNLTAIRVPSASVDAYKAAPVWSNYASLIVAQ